MSREQYETQWKDYYQVLSVNPDASARAIRRVWQQLSQIYHPDVAGDSQVSSTRMQELNEAYEVLSNTQRRAKYDQAYQSRSAQGSAPSGAPAEQQASPPPPPPPSRASRPAVHQPPAEDAPPIRAERRRGLARHAKLIAAAGAVGVAALVGIGVLPGLLSSGRGTSDPLPASFGIGTPTPTPAPALELTPKQTQTPSLPPTAVPTTESNTPTPEVAPTPNLGARKPILVMSPEAEALGFRNYQVSGNPWMVDFTNGCQEAPCLRSGPISGTGVSTLRLSYDLSDSVRTFSFDFKASSPACCASFKIFMSGIAGLKPVAANLPGGATWTRVEVAVPEVRPRTVTLEWEFWSGPSGLTGADGIWVDNIQSN